jgi:hypothetical protein
VSPLHSLFGDGVPPVGHFSFALSCSRVQVVRYLLEFRYFSVFFPAWGSRFVKKIDPPEFLSPYKAIICLQVFWKSIWNLYYFNKVVEIYGLACRVHSRHFSVVLPVHESHVWLRLRENLSENFRYFFEKSLAPLLVCCISFPLYSSLEPTFVITTITPTQPFRVVIMWLYLKTFAVHKNQCYWLHLSDDLMDFRNIPVTYINMIGMSN